MERNGAASGKTRVLIVDDHKMFCESLSSLFSMKKEVAVLGTANSGKEAIHKAELLKPDIILMDIEMEGLDGIETMRKIREKLPSTEVIMLTMHSDEEYVLEAIKAGAKGYVLKDFSSSQLLEAIKSVRKGGIFFDPKSSQKVIRSLQNQHGEEKGIGEEKSTLSLREREILRLISEGYTNKEISNRLFISAHTTRNHIANIFMKLDCHTRTKAVIEGKKRGLA